VHIFGRCTSINTCIVSQSFGGNIYSSHIIDANNVDRFYTYNTISTLTNDTSSYYIIMKGTSSLPFTHSI